MRRKVFGLILLALASSVGGSGCGSHDGGVGNGGNATDKAGDTVVRVKGSDTMVNVAKAWADKYSQKHSDVSVQVSGGGSGVGIAALINGTCDLADTSRKMKDAEIQQVKEKRGVDADRAHRRLRFDRDLCE